MATFNHNIVGSTATLNTLLKPGDNAGNIRSILITNVHDTADATITLFIENSPLTGTSSSFHLLHTVALPADCSILLDNSSMVSFDNSANAFGLYIEVGSSDTVDVLINQ